MLLSSYTFGDYSLMAIPIYDSRALIDMKAGGESSRLERHRRLRKHLLEGGGAWKNFGCSVKPSPFFY